MEHIKILLLWFLICCLSSVTGSEALSRQKRSWIIGTFSIEEGHPGPFPYELGKIEIERKYTVNFELHGEGVEDEPAGLLSIDKDSGILSVHKAVDYETHKLLKLRFEAKKGSLLDTQLRVEISILDINDNPPMFLRNEYEINITEEAAQGSFLLSVFAHDEDQKGTPNSTFHYEMMSVSPLPTNAEFYINTNGAISFKGCLQYESGRTHTVVVLAKDHGEVVSLSSCTVLTINVQDGNNHRPIFTGQTGSGKVREGETGALALRLHVTDRDTKDTPAWRAKYRVAGDDGGRFQCDTDPKTNDGLLTVVKPLDFEAGGEIELFVSVENEEPFFSCEVKERRSSGLWEVDTAGGDAGTQSVDSSRKVIIHVEDANDPPAFTVPVKDVMVEENAAIGTLVDNFTAVDPDSSNAKEFVYVIVDDPAGWVTVDPSEGCITTVKTLDRESHHVVNNVYTVIVHAEDNGTPPMTGTGTLRIHIRDQNDNAPQLTVNHLSMCLSGENTSANITAFDPDQEPYGGPFRFELVGDNEEKWRIDPQHGYTVMLGMGPHVYGGFHDVELKIWDMQGRLSNHNLSVTVCDCSVSPICQRSRAAGIQFGYKAIGVVFLSLFLLLFTLLLVILISCKKELPMMQLDHSSENVLLKSNIEEPGTDCMISNRLLPKVQEKQLQIVISNRQQFAGSIRCLYHSSMNLERLLMNAHDYQQQVVNLNKQEFASGIHHVDHSTLVYSQYNLHYNGCMENTDLQLDGRSEYTGHSLGKHQRYSINFTNIVIISLLNKKLSSIQAPGEELGDYEPYVYTEEGDFETHSELDPIPIPDLPFDIEAMQPLWPKFKNLAAICMPPEVTE